MEGVERVGGWGGKSGSLALGFCAGYEYRQSTALWITFERRGFTATGIARKSLALVDLSYIDLFFQIIEPSIFHLIHSLSSVQAGY